MSTGRSKGRHTPRQENIEPNTPEGDGIGASDRMQGTPSPIPGGRVHITNAPAMRQRVDIPASPPEVKDLNAHGVTPPTHTARDRADAMRGPNSPKQPHIPAYDTVDPGPVPVPVRLVEADRPRVLRTSSHRKFAVQPSTGEAVRLCGQDFDRTYVQLLNEDAANAIRVAQRPADLNSGGGTLLPAAATGYLKIDTQDELYAISANGSAPTISIIQVFEQPW